MTAFDLVLGGVPRFAAESPWARRLIERFAREISPRVSRRAWGRRPLVADASGSSDHVLVLADAEAFLLPVPARRLLAALDREGCDLALPVTNEPWSEELRYAPPFPYHTASMLAEAVLFTAGQAADLRQLVAPRSPVFALRRKALAALPSDLPLDQAPEEASRRGFGVFCDPGAYLQRYGDMDGQARSDLAARVPPEARCVLDVGCSRAATASLLRQRGVTRVVGIEPDREDAAEAADRCDQVIVSSLEEVQEDFSGCFDAVLFGDVLEHLPDPAAALARIRPWLSPRGVVVASVPNLGHWSIVADLLEGRFDYIPYSILSGTHIRFFTRRTLTDLFEACGFAVQSIETVTFPPSPSGAPRLAALESLGAVREDLTAVELLAVARSDPG